MMGCSAIKAPPEAVTQIVKEYVYVRVPAEFTTPIVPHKPMAIKDYLDLNSADKEYALTMYSNRLLADIAQCNITSLKLKQWDDEQRKIHEK